MNKTSTLEIIQNLRQEGLDLTNLNEKQIIRIEKTLKAKIKLDKSLDINDLEAVIHLLRTQSEHLELFLNEDFSTVREMLQNKKYVFFSADSLNKIKAKAEKLKPFLRDFFFDELIAYARRCIDDNHYRALYEFLSISTLLDEEILNVIRKQMEQRFLLFSETFRLHANKKPDKVLSLMNPFFYRCINVLNRDAIFEDRVIRFHDLIFNKKREVSSNIFICLIYSLTNYSPFGESNKETILQNHRYSVDQGAHIPVKRYKNSNFRGGSECKVKTKSTFNFQNLLVLTIPTLIIIIFFSYYAPKDHHSKSLPMTEGFSQEMQNLKHLTPSREGWKYNRLYNNYLPDAKTIQYLQFGNPEIIERNPFDIKKLYAFKKSPNESYYSIGFLKLENLTTNYLILIMQDQRSDSTFLLLRPLENKNVSFELSKLTIYTGSRLEEVVYLDKNDSIMYGLKFNEFDKSNEKAFKKNYTFEDINIGKYHSVKIFNDSSNDTGIGVSHTMSTHYFKK